MYGDKRIIIDLELFTFTPDTDFSYKQNSIYFSILRELAYKIKVSVLWAVPRT